MHYGTVIIQRSEVLARSSKLTVGLTARARTHVASSLATYSHGGCCRCVLRLQTILTHWRDSQSVTPTAHKFSCCDLKRTDNWAQGRGSPVSSNVAKLIQYSATLCTNRRGAPKSINNVHFVEMGHGSLLGDCCYVRVESSRIEADLYAFRVWCETLMSKPNIDPAQELCIVPTR